MTKQSAFFAGRKQKGKKANEKGFGGTINLLLQVSHTLLLLLLRSVFFSLSVYSKYIVHGELYLLLPCSFVIVVGKFVYDDNRESRIQSKKVR